MSRKSMCPMKDLKIVLLVSVEYFVVYAKALFIWSIYLICSLNTLVSTTRLDIFVMILVKQ